MSVLVHDLKTFKAVYNKAVTYKFNRTCNIDYCNTLSLEDGELQKHVTNWCYLNEWSFNRKYKGGNILPYLYQMLTFKYKREKINTYQMLKYLSSIYYNIELDTIKIGRTGNEPIEIDFFMLESYKILEKTIDELKSTIIAQIPEYKKAKWA